MNISDRGSAVDLSTAAAGSGHRFAAWL